MKLFDFSKLTVYEKTIGAVMGLGLLLILAVVVSRAPKASPITPAAVQNENKDQDEEGILKHRVCEFYAIGGEHLSVATKHQTEEYILCQYELKHYDLDDLEYVAKQRDLGRRMLASVCEAVSEQPKEKIFKPYLEKPYSPRKDARANIYTQCMEYREEHY